MARSFLYFKYRCDLLWTNKKRQQNCCLFCPDYIRAFIVIAGIYLCYVFLQQC